MSRSEESCHTRATGNSQKQAGILKFIWSLIIVQRVDFVHRHEGMT